MCFLGPGSPEELIVHSPEYINFTKLINDIWHEAGSFVNDLLGVAEVNCLA